MNKWKILAIIFTFISYRAVKETFRIFTSSAEDIAPNRLELIIISVALTSISVFFTIRFWRKASVEKYNKDID
jgi:hypothetical protein